MLIIAPEEARRASTTFAIDTKHPSPPGLETDISGEVSLAPGQVGIFRLNPVLIIIVLIVQGERERERERGGGGERYLSIFYYGRLALIITVQFKDIGDWSFALLTTAVQVQVYLFIYFSTVMSTFCVSKTAVTPLGVTSSSQVTQAYVLSGERRLAPTTVCSAQSQLSVMTAVRRPMKRVDRKK